MCKIPKCIHWKVTFQKVLKIYSWTERSKLTIYHLLLKIYAFCFHKINYDVWQTQKIEKKYLSYYQKSNQGRDILYQSHIEHYATAPDTKTLSSNASTALSPNKSQPGKFLLTCNINTEEKGPKWFFLWFYERKFNNLSLHFIRLLWRRVPEQQLCILLNSLQTSANNKSVFHFSLRTPHVCLIEETWVVWERILTRVCRNTEFYNFGVSSRVLNSVWLSSLSPEGAQ